MSVKSLAALGVMAFGLAACSSLNQYLFVATTPPDAACSLSRAGKVVGEVSSTPGGMVVGKSKKDIVMVCRKQGYADIRVIVPSHQRKATLENVAATGGVGWIIDSELGTNNEYSDRITVTLQRLEGPPPPPAVWHTVTDMIIAYKNHGGAGDANFMPTSIRLKLVDERAGWGHFEYKTLDGNRHRVWIAMNSVQESR
ncbi:MAG: hypothetical protein V3T02_05805 [Alphaproteobacteria bacterium]